MTEVITYVYNLQNRLKRVETDYQNDTVEFTEYEYNVDGIRISKHTWTEIDSVSQGDDVYTSYLVDAYNHTGYTQVLEETVDNGSTPITTTYTIGDDVITQYNASTDPEHLLYDGHGSTRQLVDNTGSGIVDTFSYDAYGVMLGGNPTSPVGTNLLYAGEWFDTKAQHYYLRARWYDSSNGLFNRIDPYSGNQSYPQSLHKYAYCHNDPVNNIDPSGEMNIPEINITVAIQSVLFTINLFSAVYHARGIAVSFQALYNRWAVGDFWGGIPYIVISILHGFFLILNMIGMNASMTPPPSGPVPAMVGVGATGAGQFWVTATSNPAMAGWIVKTVGPAAMSAYIAFFANRGNSGSGSSRSSSSNSQDHHKIPLDSKTYNYSDHPLVKKAGWTEADIDKDPANILRLGNHAGRHSSAYHRAIREMLDEAHTSVIGKGQGAAEKALLKVLNQIDKDIANGTLKPYINKDVWIIPGE